MDSRSIGSRKSSRLLKLNDIYSTPPPNKELTDISFASPIKKIKGNNNDSISFLSPTSITKVSTDQKKRNVKEMTIKRSLEGDYSEISKSKLISSPINIKYETTKRKLYEQEIEINDGMDFPIIKNKRIKSDKSFYDKEDICNDDIGDNDDDYINDIEYIKLKKERQMIAIILHDDNISVEEKQSIRIKLSKSWANLEDEEDIENEYYQYLSLK